MATQIKLRRDTDTNWTANSTVVLAAGEIGVNLTNGQFKLGNGTSTWAQLTYFQPGAGTSDRLVNGLQSVTLEANGNITAPAFTIPNTAGTSGQVLKWPGSGSTLVWAADSSTTNKLVNGVNEVVLGSDGTLTLPDSATVAAGDIIVLQGLELAYDTSREQLNAAFAADSYEGDGWPAGPNSYNALLLSTDPAIQPEWIPLAQSVRTAWLALGSALEPIYLDIQVAGHTWLFSNAGDLYVPGNKAIKGFDNLQLNVDGGGGKTAVVEIDGYNSKVLIKTTTPGAGIPDDAWTFGDAGELTLPVGGVIQTLTTPEVGTRLTDIPGWIRADTIAKTAGFWMDITPQSLKDAMDATGLVDWRFNPDGTADYYTVLAAEYVEDNTILELTFDANLPLESAPYSVTSPNYSARTSSNISILANENEWTFDADGKLRLPGSILFPNALEYTENGIITSTDTGLGISLSRNLELSAVAAVNSGQGQLYIDTSANNDTSEVDIFWKLNTGTFGVPVLTPITSVITPTPGVRRISVTGVTFVVGQTYTFRRDLIDSVSWLFQSDGTLRTSGLGTISHYPGLTSSLKLEVPGSNNIVLRTTGGNLTFGADGSLTLPSTLNYPNSALQRDTALVMCPGNASTVVYIASADIQHTVKLLIQVEGLVGAETLPDTQSCEMIVAKSFRGNNIAATVYAIVHTSIAPLATFTAEWNAVTSRVEVICTPTGANGVNVKSFATEITAVVT